MVKKALNFVDFKARYLKSNREGKSQLLDELCELYGYNRKYLLQVFHGLVEKEPKPRGRKSQYKYEELLAPLKRIWLATDQICGKRLKVAIELWLPQKNQIPIKTDHWDVSRPGFLEADTVAHCGNSIAGDYVWSITLTDILLCWTEIRATWNKGADGVVTQIKEAEKGLPFPILGFDCDNGSEFLNWHLIRYFTDGRDQKIQFTRSRPYRKNGNAHVEQKNWTHVRHLFGYDRFENPKLVALMNDLYANEWSLYQNHFMPTQKLIKKEKINSKYRKKYDKPKTPYQRLLDCSFIDPEIKMQRALLHQALNPFELKKTIEKKLKNIFNYVVQNKKPRTKL